MRAAPLIALLVLALALAACGDEGDGAAPTATAGIPPAGILPTADPGGLYLALGDSLAFGTGASDPERTDYVALVADALRAQVDPQLELAALAVAGATTQDVLDDQLPAALDRLREGDSRLITITIGGNDLFTFGAVPACREDPTDPECPLQDGLVDIELRLDEILSSLRAAAPETTIVILIYPNPFSGTGDRVLAGVQVYEHAAQTSFDLLDSVIADVATRHDVLLANPRDAFEGRGGELTHLLDEQPDPHPNDAGYRVIANAFLQTLGLPTDAETP